MTEKLYEQDPYLREFTAAVRSCTEEKNVFAVVLDRTAFYPEGGGQPGDRGSLGNAEVVDTRQCGEEIVHLCTSPLPVGSTVTGSIDWERRFDLMQQHSGEHIVSGLICSSFGCDNVGFHLGAELVVIDFNKPIPAEQLSKIEARANQVIWENRPFVVTYPTPETLKTIPYRSKKALSGQVRIVECPGADCCACCGTHVRSAGELGLIKLLSVKPFRDGSRIELLSGRRAYAYVAEITAQNDLISLQLSAKTKETAKAVRRLQAELAEVKYRATALENRSFARQAAMLQGAGDVLLFEEGLSPDGVRRCCDAVAAVCGGRCAVFSGDDGAGYQYAMALRGGDLRSLVRTMNTALQGRGGGKPDFVQGAVMVNRAVIEAFFQNR